MVATSTLMYAPAHLACGVRMELLEKQTFIRRKARENAVIAIDEPLDRIFVVTVYRPSAKRWEDDWRTRK